MRRFPLVRPALALGALLAAAAGCADFVASPAVAAEAGAATAAQTRYVDPASGSDAANGLTAQTAYATLRRAVSDIPDRVDGPWTVRLAAGEYRETVRLDRFVMSVNPPRPELDSIKAFIALIGPQTGTAVLVPAVGEPCVVGVDVLLFVQRLECRARRGNGVVAGGSTLLLDDVALVAADSSVSGVHTERTELYLGGLLRFQGAWEKGISARSYTLVRPGTLRNSRMRLEFTDVHTGVFLRDFSTLTTTFSPDTLVFRRVRRMVKAEFQSQAYLNSQGWVQGEDVHTAFEALQLSGINAHRVRIDRVRTLALCGKSSYIFVERGTYTAVAGPATQVGVGCNVKV
jgi:hypothetical protein